MRVLTFYFVALLSALAVLSLVPNVKREPSAQPAVSEPIGSLHSLEKRKGGGGGGKGGGGSSSSGGKSGSSSSSSSGGSSSGGTSRTSNVGGRSSGGSGPKPIYGGGRFYGGGSSVPYSAGKKTPKGLLPLTLLPVAALAFFPGVWLAGAYLYPYSHPYTYFNNTINRNVTLPVKCLCQEFSVCGCDDNDDQQYLQSVIGDTANLNTSLVQVATVNGTTSVWLNGTLPNGTTAAGSASLNARPSVMAWWVVAGAMAFAISLL